jgi:hypothetical protein
VLLYRDVNESKGSIWKKIGGNCKRSRVPMLGGSDGFCLARAHGALIIYLQNDLPVFHFYVYLQGGEQFLLVMKVHHILFGGLLRSSNKNN